MHSTDPMDTPPTPADPDVLEIVVPVEVRTLEAEGPVATAASTRWSVEATAEERGLEVPDGLVGRVVATHHELADVSPWAREWVEVADRRMRSAGVGWDEVAFVYWRVPR